MKKLFITLLFSVTSIFSQTKIEANLPSIAKIFGIGPKEKLTIFNPTPLTAKVDALGKFLTAIPPDGMVWGTHPVLFNGEQYPLLAWMYDGSGKRIGVAFAAPSLYERQIGSWIINQVYYPDGRCSFYNPYGVSPYGNPDLPEDREVDFPRTVLGTTVYVQFINCTYFDVQVKLGTGHEVVIPSLNDITLPYENVLKIDGTIPVNFVYGDRGRAAGWSQSSYSVWTSNTPRAVQILLLPSLIQRAPY